jgi:hypothetical protein
MIGCDVVECKCLTSWQSQIQNPGKILTHVVWHHKLLFPFGTKKTVDLCGSTEGRLNYRNLWHMCSARFPENYWGEWGLAYENLKASMSWSNWFLKKATTFFCETTFKLSPNVFETLQSQTPLIPCHNRKIFLPFSEKNDCSQDSQMAAGDIVTLGILSTSWAVPGCSANLGVGERQRCFRLLLLQTPGISRMSSPTEHKSTQVHRLFC